MAISLHLAKSIDDFNRQACDGRAGARAKIHESASLYRRQKPHECPAIAAPYRQVGLEGDSGHEEKDESKGIARHIPRQGLDRRRLPVGERFSERLAMDR